MARSSRCGSPMRRAASCRAYIRAVRFYNDALKDGRLDGPTSDEAIAILAEATPVKSRDIYKLITPTGMNPDGRVNKKSLLYDLAFYRKQGLIKGSINLDDVIDGSFVEAALTALGPYRPAAVIPGLEPTGPASGRPDDRPRDGARNP